MRFKVHDVILSPDRFQMFRIDKNHSLWLAIESPQATQIEALSESGFYTPDWVEDTVWWLSGQFHDERRGGQK